MHQPNAATVTALLRDAGMLSSTVTALEGGQTAWSFTVDDEWIVQFPRFDASAHALRTATELMPVVGAAVPFGVPVPELVGEYAGQPVFRYRMVPGRPFRASGDPRELARMLRALHNVQVDPAVRALGVDSTLSDWWAGQFQFRARLEEVLFPRLPTALRTVVSAEYDSFLAQQWDFTPVFVHSDLGVEHVLVDDAGRLSGVIDFDWSGIGDPALDFAGLYTDLGERTVSKVIAAYGAGIPWQRVFFYWWLTPCYPLVYAGGYLDEEFVEAGIRTVRERLIQLGKLRAAD